jgi:hypothetical protein
MADMVNKEGGLTQIITRFKVGVEGNFRGGISGLGGNRPFFGVTPTEVTE